MPDVKDIEIRQYSSGNYDTVLLPKTSAENVTYEQTNVDAALDDRARSRMLSESEYNALSSEEKNNGMAYIIVGASATTDVPYTRSQTDYLIS